MKAQNKARVVDVIALFVASPVEYYLNGKPAAFNHLVLCNAPMVDLAYFKLCKKADDMRIAYRVLNRFRPFNRRKVKAKLTDLNVKRYGIAQYV